VQLDCGRYPGTEGHGEQRDPPEHDRDASPGLQVASMQQCCSMSDWRANGGVLGGSNPSEWHTRCIEGRAPLLRTESSKGSE
jgi:hypothetical protein